VRTIAPSPLLKNPIGIDVGSDGTVYFAELDLDAEFRTRCGRVSQVRFDTLGDPPPQEVPGWGVLTGDGGGLEEAACASREAPLAPEAAPPCPE
jgi:hypothetical protein